MADWVGRVSALLTPLVLLIRAHIAALDRIHTDDTPVDVLDPGRGKTKTGRVWVYVFDGSGYQSATPATIAYYYSPDRKGAHPADHLATFSGVMHGGYKKLYGNQIILKGQGRSPRAMINAEDHAVAPLASMVAARA